MACFFCFLKQMQKINLLKNVFSSYIFLFLIFVLSFSLLTPSSVFAFTEDFNNYPLDETTWETYPNAGEINIDSGIVGLSAESTTTFPFIYSKVNLIPLLGDFSVKFKMKYNKITRKGTGLVLSTISPQNGTGDTPLNSPLFSQKHFLEVWQDSNLGFIFAYSGDCYNQSCSLGQVLVYQKGTTDLDYHNIEFQYSDNQYSIFLDENKVFTSNPIEIRPTILWFGNYTLQPSGYWTEFEIEHIRISPLSSPTPTPTVIPTPTPTPTPTLLKPIVLLPGLGSSWNHENIILGIEKPQYEWYMTPGIKIYDGLIETLRNAGYKTEGEDKNLFVFNYNWTKPVNSITEDFKIYIENVVNPSSEEKINLLGHSLGGLIARSYIQNNQENSVDQLITLGSPLKGVPSVYYLWEGGNLGKFLPTWQRIGVGLLLHLRKPGFSTNTEVLRTITPIFNDLLPTFNYLKQDGNEKELNQMSEKNDWLISLNNSLPNHLLSVTNNFLGSISNSTNRWINVVDPNWLDRLLGLWSDGRPSGEELNEGDTVVLSESAFLNGATITNLENIDHQEIVTSFTSQEKIMEAFKLNPSSISTISSNLNYNSYLVFQIASPAIITVTDPDGNLTGNGKLIIIDSPLSGKYQINLTGIATGPYNLYIGQIIDNENLWTTTSGSINEGDEINYKIIFNPSSPLENPIIDQTGETYTRTAQNQISNLRKEIDQLPFCPFAKKFILIKLNRIEFLLNKGEFKKTIISLYRFRFIISFWQETGRLDKNKSLYFKNETQEIIDNLEEVYIIHKTNKGKIYNQRRLKIKILLAQKSFKKMEKRLQRISKKGIINSDYGALYLLSQTKLNKAKASTSYRAYINSLGVRFLSREGFFLFK